MVTKQRLTSARTTEAGLLALRHAALDRAPVSGLTHNFYRYPARFSPQFAAAAIEAFSQPGDLILDPYMGGATTIVESIARGRRAVGCDLNSLAVFIARAKTSILSADDRKALKHWADSIVPTLSYWLTPDDLDDFVCAHRTQNLTLPTARPIKKVLTLALRSLSELTDGAPTFARCALLNAGQWALNGSGQQPNLNKFRERLQTTVHEMLAGVEALGERIDRRYSPPVLINDSAARIGEHEPFASGARASLAVTSPPYPGIHMLYHRWQVDGRRESAAPYWLGTRKAWLDRFGELGTRERCAALGSQIGSQLRHVPIADVLLLARFLRLETIVRIKKRSDPGRNQIRKSSQPYRRRRCRPCAAPLGRRRPCVWASF